MFIRNYELIKLLIIQINYIINLNDIIVYIEGMINMKSLVSLLMGFAIVSTLSINAKASTYKTTPIAPYRYAKKEINPKVYKVSYKYNAAHKQILIKGQAVGFSKIAVKYGHNKVRFFNVNKHSLFDINYRFKGYSTFTVYGVNNKGSRVSKPYKISSKKYATEKPVVYKNTRNKKGEKIYLRNVVPSTIRIFNRGKLVKKIVADASTNTIFISQKQLRKSNSITIDQKAFHKKTSISVKVPKLSIGENNVINY
jgi:hypothetical protein